MTKQSFINKVGMERIYQFTSFIVTAGGFISWIVLQRNGFSQICRSSPFASWIDYYIHVYFGGAVLLTITLICRSCIPLLGFTIGNLRYHSCVSFTSLIAIANLVAFVSLEFSIHPQTCTNFLGIRTSPIMLMEWIATVPYLFFLTASLDDPADMPTASSTIICQFLSAACFVFA
jgi:hypothetical protein